MSTKKIYLIRHGQTDFNQMGIVQGSGVDTSLNETGRKQALAFFESYKDIPFDKIYTSVLKRSIESVKFFLEMGIPHEAFSGLNEISWGNKEGQTINPEEDKYYHNMLDHWRKGDTNHRIEGGESPEDVTKRLVPVMDYILTKNEEKRILICMHGRAMRILMCYLLKHPLEKMDTFEHTNLGLYLITYSKGEFTVELHNDTTHLMSLHSVEP